MVDCPVAEAIWRALAQAINECFEQVHRPGIVIQAENILFNDGYQTPQDSSVDSEQISEAIMIAKHTIVKIKYREGNNAPSARLANMLLILDMEKAIMAKEKCNTSEYEQTDRIQRLGIIIIRRRHSVHV